MWLERLEATAATAVRAAGRSRTDGARGGPGARRMSAPEADPARGSCRGLPLRVLVRPLRDRPRADSGASGDRAAILVALVAVVMTRAHRTLAAVAVGVATLAFFFGMVVAVLTDSALY